MWNERDPVARRRHLEAAVVEDVEFCDPAYDYVGRDALEANVVEVQADPDVQFEVASGFDHHHNRYRYNWRVVKHGEVLVQGMDVTTVDADGMLVRIDGFFGPIPELPTS